MQALKYPLIMICAGAGYGKTSAVYDFTQKYKAETAWIQLSERDNVGGRFWENYLHSMRLTLLHNRSAKRRATEVTCATR